MSVVLWASQVALVVQDLPANAENIKDLHGEDPQGEGTATHSSVLDRRIPMDRGPWQAIVQRVTKSWTQLK